jgi:hypothetical protein
MDEINNVVAASHQLGMYCTSLSATSWVLEVQLVLVGWWKWQIHQVIKNV